MADNTLRDGFQELYTLTGGHKRSLRGCASIGLVDERSQNLRKRDCILSWDANCVILWENGAVIHELKFPKSKECYISCVTYITKLNVFFGPAMDMTFNIYDQRLRLIESINHEERVILGCHYDIEKDIMVMSGGSGVSVWRIKKCSMGGSQLETSTSFLVEKIFAFEGCTDWVSKLIFEPQQHRAYAVSDTTVTILNVKTRKVEFSVSELHETPVTACLWYPSDKFYITACMNGIVRCWFVKEKLDDRGEGGGTVAGAAVTLHSFHAHARAVTGLCLHPRRGLLVTAGMDACVKVFDLEVFTQVQSIQTAEGITHFRMGTFAGSPMCVFAQLSGDLAVWRIESCCSEFSACSANISKLTPFQNMNEFYSMHRSQICYDEGDALGSGIGFDRYGSGSGSGSSSSSKLMSRSVLQQASAVAAGAAADPPPHSTSGRGLLQEGSTSLSCKSQDNKSTLLPQYIADLDKTLQDKLPPAMLRNASEVREELLFDEHYKRNFSMVAFAGHDLQVLSPTGAVLSRCTADSLIDGVTHYTLSVFQQLLFCLMESGALRVFCTRTPTSVLLREIFVGALSADTVCAMQLVEGMSLGPLRASSTSKDMRGDPSPLNLNEAILIGTANGALLCIDTFQECALVLTQQVSKSEVQCLRYRPFRNELIVVAKKTIASALSSVKVFKVPEMVLTHAFPCDNVFACAAVSSDENFVIIGNTHGSHQLVKLFDPLLASASEAGGKRFNLELCDVDKTHGRFVEVLHQDSDHVGAITGISFCDKLGAYATSAMDSAIKFWDFKKRCLKTILLDVPSRDVLFNWPVGSLLVTQRDLLQSIPHEAWRNEPAGEGGDVAEEQDQDCDSEEEPQSTPISVQALGESRVSSGRSQLHSRVTFLTAEDDDEAAEMAFLRAALNTKGNLEDYWKKHSSVGFGAGKLRGRRRARAPGNSMQESGVKFDVRNPAVPVPPRRSKINYFKRRSQKELEAQQAPPRPHSSDTGSRVLSDHDLSDDEDRDVDIFDRQDSSEGEGEASALEDLVGRKEARGTSAGKSLLVKTRSFSRKATMTASTPRSSMASRMSVSYFQNTSKSSMGSFDSNEAAIVGLLQTQKSWEVVEEVEEEEEEGGGEVELFLKPSGPRARGKLRASFQRAVRPHATLTPTPNQV